MTKIIGSWKTKEGYTMLKLSNHKCIPLHKLIWENITKSKVPLDYEIHHKDGNIDRNCISNLGLTKKEINVRGYRG